MRCSRGIVKSRSECFWIQFEIFRADMAPLPCVSSGNRTSLSCVKPAKPRFDSRIQRLQLFFFQAFRRDQIIKREQKRRWICPISSLNNKRIWNALARFVVENLLARNPAIFVEKIKPVAKRIDGDFRVEAGYKQLMESFVPKKTARKEGSARNGGVKWSIPIWSHFFSFLLNQRMSVIISDSADHIRNCRHCEFEMFFSRIFFLKF